jgi:Rieske Fe-S protein
MPQDNRTDDESRQAVDARLNTDAREGLTGTTPASIYKPAPDPEQITQAPDGRSMDQQPAWRNDFPIDGPQDQYVARRDFMKFMVLTSLAFTAGQATLGVKSLMNRPPAQAGEKLIGSLREVPVGGVLMFNYPEEKDACILIRTSESELLAYSQKCTHLSCAVIPKPSEGIIHCPCHEGYFDLKTGRPLAGPPPRPLPRIVLSLRGDQIYATGIERGTV